MAPGHQLRHQPPPQNPAPARHEHPDNQHLPIPEFDSQTRDETTPTVCDMRGAVGRRAVIGTPRRAVAIQPRGTSGADSEARAPPPHAPRESIA
jgi:hypothetical protein